jgi:hypothetical protein
MSRSFTFSFILLKYTDQKEPNELHITVKVVVTSAAGVATGFYAVKHKGSIKLCL